MRSRDEVLREFCPAFPTTVSKGEVEAMADRIRELEQERHEDQGVISVWRGRTERAEQRLRELEAQQAASEPVAWMVMNGYTGEVISYHASEVMANEMKPNHHAYAVIPLYTRPTTPTRGSDE